MRISGIAAIVACGLLCLCCAAGCGAPTRRNDAKRLAAAFVDSLAEGDFAGARRDFGPKMVAAASPEALKATWEAVIAAGGPLRDVSDRGTRVGESSEVVQLTLHFQRATAELRVVVSLPADGPRQILGVSGLSIPPAAGGAISAARSEGVTKATMAFISALQREDFAAAVRDFGPEMRKAAPPEGLQAMWASLTYRVGALQEVLRARAVREGGYDAVYVSARFEVGPSDIKVVFRKAETGTEIVGLFFEALQ